MIGNSMLRELYLLDVDIDTKINQLLEVLKRPDEDFVISVSNEIPDIDSLEEEEFKFMVIVSSIIEYFFTERNVNVPNWIKNGDLKFKEPYFYNRRLTESYKLKILNDAPVSFKKHNVYFDMHGLSRM